MSRPVFYGEVQLVRFGDGSRSGPTITLRLSEVKALDLFRGSEGQRYMLALAEINDTEEDAKPPADAAPPEPAAPALPKGGRLARQAGIMCADRAFQRQVERAFPAFWTAAMTSAKEVDPADAAAIVIREVCGITSRAQLDSDAAAAEKFAHCFWRPWRDAEAGITP